MRVDLTKSAQTTGSLSGAGLSLRFVLFFISYITVYSCSTKTESTAYSASPKFEQYFVQGEQLYLKNCSNCHQPNGSGLGLLYPPLNQSDFMQNNFEEVICILKNGRKGEIIVNGKGYNKEMAAIPLLTDLEIAEIATYIYNSWSHERGIVEVSIVSRILSVCDSLTVIR